MSTPLVSKARSTTRSQTKNKSAAAQPDSNIVRRCSVCGNMDLEDAFDHYPATIDGTRHNLMMCRNNGACVYAVQQLAERLEFREIEGAPMPRRTLLFDGDDHSPLSKAIAEYRIHGGVGDLPDNQVVELICMFWNQHEGDKYIGIAVEDLEAFIASKRMPV